VIIGHSERRQYLGESCRLVNAKAQAALDQGLVPIICVGESLAKRQSGASSSFVAGQVKRALAGIKLQPKQSLVIAYEPIWAIGTGKVIKPGDAALMHRTIKALTAKLLGHDAAVQVIYGGSVDDNNASALLALDEIDGFLVGGASLNAEKFYKIANIKQ
jgi:triosephosphate isomerase